jgi:hypothetical protein
MRPYLESMCLTALILFMLGVVGCAGNDLPHAAVVVGSAMTNAAPAVTAAAGIAATVPGGQPYAPLIGGLAALMSAFGGYLVRHYSSPAVVQSVPSPQPQPLKSL